MEIIDFFLRICIKSFLSVREQLSQLDDQVNLQSSSKNITVKVDKKSFRKSFKWVAQSMSVHVVSFKVANNEGDIATYARTIFRESRAIKSSGLRGSCSILCVWYQDDF